MQGHCCLTSNSNSYNYFLRLINPVGPCIKIVIDDISSGCKEHSSPGREKRTAGWKIAN